MNLHQARPFDFGRIFSAGVDAGVPPADLSLEVAALRAELALLKAEQETACTIARAEGFEAGLAQARAEREVALLSAVDALQASIETIDTRFDETEKRLTADATEVAIAAADLLAARALETAPGAAVDGAIGRVLRQVARGTEIQVRVHPDLLEDMEARIAARQSMDRRRLNLIVVPDEKLALGDARLNWDQGALVLDAEARRAEVLAELDSLLPK